MSAIQSPPENPGQLERWVDAFEERDAVGGERESLRELRRRAMRAFQDEGFPTTSLELWRYTNVQSIARTDYGLTAAPSSLSQEALDAISPPTIAADAHRLVFVDGHFAPELSSHSRTAWFSPLSAAIAAGEELDLGRCVDPEGHPFAALNTAFFVDGAWIHLAADEKVAAPIHLIHVTTAGAKPRAVHARHLIQLAAGARATLVETYLGQGSGETLSTAVIEVQLEREAELQHVKLQLEEENAAHIAQGAARLAQGARFDSHLFSLGARLARNAFDVVLLGEQASCRLAGLYVCDGSRHADCQTYVDHAVPHGTSEQHYRGVLDGQSHGVFNGRVLVREDAQKTDAQQQNANLLLSRDASVDTKPQLEIYADDVKCSHGATIGQLDPQAIFYLRSRGIGEHAARGMLTRAFADEILDEIELEPLRRFASERLHSKLSDAAASQGV